MTFHKAESCFRIKIKDRGKTIQMTMFIPANLQCKQGATLMYLLPGSDE